MRAHVLLAGVLVAMPSSAAEQQIFFAASFPDATSVQLRVLSDNVSRSIDYDFDVAIGVVKTDASGAIKYEDTGRHSARIRCHEPASVSVGARTFPITMDFGLDARDDWKKALWMTFCAVPSS
jgi:hypothetical protein